MHSTVFEISIPAGVDAAELAGVLACPEFLGAWEEDGRVVLYWNKDGVAILMRVREALCGLGVDLAEEAIRFQPVISQDWNSKWAASVQPIRIGERIGIRPSWATMHMPEHGIELIIDPKQAFGTGHHATTQILLEWLQEITWVSGMRVLDVGTGSGILAMAALRLGAAGALGIDVDATAVASAREYARINQFNAELELCCCRMESLPSQSFDVILANLDRKTILQVYREFSRLRGPHTQLVLSGLLEEDESEIVRRLEEHGWVKECSRERDGWIAIHFEADSPGSFSSG